MADELALEFFFTFQRAEYALKKAMIFKNKELAEADWTRFGQTPEISALLVSDRRGPLGEAIRYYFAHPPRQQIVKDGSLNWRDKPPNEEGGAASLLTHVCRTRNNLFHGGKSAAYLLGRDRTLVQHGLIVLQACMEAHPEVREYFHAFSEEGQ